MRVLYFSRDYTTHDRRFLLKLVEAGYEVFYLRLENDGFRYESRPLPANIQLVDWAGGERRFDKTFDGLLQRLSDFERIVKQINPDLIHAGPVQSCGFITALTGFHPYLLASWGSDILVEADKDGAWQWVTKYVLSHSDAFLCDCDAVRHKAQSFTPYADSRIVQFPWGIDPTNFSRARLPDSKLRTVFRWEDKFIFISTRTWTSSYGTETLLDAFRQAIAKAPQLGLLLLGNGPLSGYVEQYIEEHQLSEYIYRPGVITNADLPDYFKVADAYVSCTHSDGTSISLLEAMAMELPVIVTDIPGNWEWVSQGINGYLTPVGKADSLAQAFVTVAEMPANQRQQMGQRNRAVVEAKANWDRNFGKLLAAYERLVPASG